MVKLDLTQEESYIFEEVLSDEERCLANNFDDYTGKRPGKKRMLGRDMLQTILKKWETEQNILPFSEDDDSCDLWDSLDPIACTLELTEKEAAYCRELCIVYLAICKEDLVKYKAQETDDIVREIADNARIVEAILPKLQA